MSKIKLQSQLKLNTQEMEEQLDKYLDPVLSFRRSANLPASTMANLTIEQQQFGLHWVSVIAATNAEMAYQFAANYANAVTCLQQNLEAVESWIIESMSAFDKKGLQLSMTVLHNSQKFADNFFKKQQGVSLDEIKKVLTTYVCGLSGRPLKIALADSIYTDTETLFLPGLISDYGSKEKNYLYYKLLTVYLWAQNWYGTWHYDLDWTIQSYEDSKKALLLFHNIETIRLLQRVKDKLPGFYRQISHFLEDYHQLQQLQQWQPVFFTLSNTSCTVETSFKLLAKHYSLLNPVAFHFQGILNTDEVVYKKNQRILKDKKLFRELLAKISAEKKPEQDEKETINEPTSENNFSIKKLNTPINEEQFTDTVSYELSLDGQAIMPSDEMQSLISNIYQDLGEIPEEYLVAAGSSHYVIENHQTKDNSEDVWSGVYHERDAFFYDEWDHIRQHYRKNWCVLREVEVSGIYDDFIQKTVSQYRGIIKSLRCSFEELKDENINIKRQSQGDEFDIDAIVESYADLSIGMELSEKIFIRRQKEERNIAVIFLVDMSGSTKGWINRAEREALVLLCESLEILDDRYAIYGFSGTSRKRCEIYPIKHIHEDYNAEVKARISGIIAKDYTRMGAAIRHVSHLLEEVEARTKLLITLSDGKPDDYDDQYRGEYGIEDTRKALFEAKQKGIHPYCITIDKDSGDYLPHMYGAANYALIEDIHKLPKKVTDIYRKLTS